MRKCGQGLVVLALCLWLAAQAGKAGDGPATQTAVADTQPTQAVLDVVKRLDADSYTEREKAQADLVALGATAEPSLRTLLQTELSAEARARVEFALVKIAKDRMVAGASITLHYTEAAAATVLEDFAKQAGGDLGIHRREMVDFLANKKITINVEQVSFWKAVQLLGKNTGLTLVSPGYQESFKMTLEIPGQKKGEIGRQDVVVDADAGTRAGLFIVVPQSCTLTRWQPPGRNVRNAAAATLPVKGIAGPDGDLQLLLKLVCACEPKRRLLSPINRDCVQQIVDDKGRDLLGDPVLAVTKSATFFTGMDGPRWYLPITLQLKDYPDRGRKIAMLKGVIKAVVCLKTTEWVLDDVMKPGVVTQKIGGASFTFKGATTAGKQKWSQNNGVLLEFAVDGPEASSRSAYVNAVDLAREMRLTDADGKAMSLIMRMWSGDDGTNHQVMQMQAGETGTPKKLVWEVPVESQAVEIPFELHDIPLPP